MSKIFDAYRKRVGDSSDLSLEFGRVGSVVLYPTPDDRQQDEFNRLAARLQGLKSEGHGIVLCFASSTHGEGASFVSYNTASYLAHSYQKKVAWIDGNFLKPQNKLQGRDGITFENMLEDPDRLDDLVTPEALTLIPGGRGLVGARGLFSTEKYSELVKSLAGRFDFIIIDLPPVLNSTDASLMATETDGLLLVIEQKFLKREIIEHGLQGLRNKGVRILGSVINRRSFELPKFIYDRL